MVAVDETASWQNVIAPNSRLSQPPSCRWRPKTWAQCYKTFYCCNLRMFVNKLDCFFLLSFSNIYLLFVSKARANLVSISPIFYEQLFQTKVFCAAFMCLQFGFEIFWRKDLGVKAAHKMLVKLTPE